MSTTYAATVVFEPRQAFANVDGNPGEWNLYLDYFADMYRAGKNDKDTLAKAYLRYDPYSGLLYVLVLSELGVTVDPSPIDSTETFVKIENEIMVCDLVTIPGSQFVYIKDAANELIGWEAAFILAPGQYSIEIHNNVWDGVDTSESQTAGTIKTGLEILVTPEYYWGGLIALGVCFAAFFVYKKKPRVCFRNPI